MPREIGGIVDELIVMEFIDFGDHKPVARVCLHLTQTLGTIPRRIAADGSNRSKSRT